MARERESPAARGATGDPSRLARVLRWMNREASDGRSASETPPLRRRAREGTCPEARDLDRSRGASPEPLNGRLANGWSRERVNLRWAWRRLRRAASEGRPAESRRQAVGASRGWRSPRASKSARSVGAPSAEVPRNRSERTMPHFGGSREREAATRLVRGAPSSHRSACRDWLPIRRVRSTTR